MCCYIFFNNTYVPEPSACVQEDLYQILVEWGPLHHVRVIKERNSGISRGFAFIDFPSTGSARSMMDKLGDEGLVVDGRKLGSISGGGGPITGEYQGTIDVGEDKDGTGNYNNHHNMMNNGEDLYQILVEWGPLHHVRVIKERNSGISRGFAFIDFPSTGSARSMMDKLGDEGLVVDGRKLGSISGGGGPITGEYQGTIDVGEDKDGTGNYNNHHNMMNNGGNNNNNALDSVAIGIWKDRDSAYPMNWKYLHESQLSLPLYTISFLPFKSSPSEPTSFQVMAPSQLSLLILAVISSTPLISANSPTIYEALEHFGLPVGIFPDSVTSYTYDRTDGSFVVELKTFCFIQFDYLVHFRPKITGKINYGVLSEIIGLEAHVFGLWFNIDEIRVDVPAASKVYLKLGSPSGLSIIDMLDIKQFQTIHPCIDIALAARDHASKRISPLPITTE
ncbi:hypothetical protein L6452_23990 [Arctium lappa]|uniref:Uncharacterized protein n=1 Tax=Arctium lappa TaxID=4217 RepID=A0ACB9A903_ARCLA|nr:hypothetical protein L6452_23990 [Arctium lappa]